METVKHIKNKEKRLVEYAKKTSAARKQKIKVKKKRKRDEQELLAQGKELPPKKQPKTIENKRVFDDTLVKENDEEVAFDEKHDEFVDYFQGNLKPKILITTNYKPTKIMFEFIRDLLYVFPNSFFYSRRGYHLKRIVESCTDKGFTDIMVLNEDKKSINGMTLIHLPGGPTAHFKLSSLVLSKDLKGRGKPTSHKPEVILNNFNTRLGHRMARMLGALFDQEPNFHGRRVITFHCQRDFLFFRHHRYMFEKKQSKEGNDEVKAVLQECGPRFTLRLRSLQKGTFDSKFGEYEYFGKEAMGRTEFVL